MVNGSKVFKPWIEQCIARFEDWGETLVEVSQSAYLPTVLGDTGLSRDGIAVVTEASRLGRVVGVRKRCRKSLIHIGLRVEHNAKIQPRIRSVSMRLSPRRNRKSN